MRNIRWVGVVRDMDLGIAVKRGEYEKNTLYKTLKGTIQLFKKLYCVVH